MPPSTRNTDEVKGGEEEEMVVKEEEVTSMHFLDEWVTHILSGLRDPLEACMSDTRKKSPSPTGDGQSHIEESRRDKEDEESAAHSKEIVSEPIGMQGVAPAILSPEDQPLDSNEGSIKEYGCTRNQVTKN